MVFTSPVFLFLFLPVTLLLTMLAGDRKRQNTLLLIASLLFYAWGEGAFVLLMLGTALFNHGCGLLMERTRSPKAVVVFAVVMNLATLVWFKYSNFLVDTLNAAFAQGKIPPLALDQVHLPIGISFFIFHSLSYVVDVYRRDASAQRSPSITTLYIALFPQLVAGPIIRYHDVASQFTSRVMNAEGFAAGIRRFIIGLAKKVLVADLCARITDPIFELETATISTPVAWLGLVAYAVQIYFDFSGYSDMAIGLARMFGFHFLENFNRPYVARSLREFWKRWHISLTNFFRDYLYIPLGGNRKGSVRTGVNLLVVFFLTGLWHGASWNFVVWGMIHGAFMAAERTAFGKLLDRAPALLARMYTLFIVVIAWAFFRIEDITQAWRFTTRLFGVNAPDGIVPQPSFFLATDSLIALSIGIIGGLGLLDGLLHRARSAYVGSWRVGLGGSLALLALFTLTCMAISTSTYDPFLYFRF